MADITIVNWGFINQLITGGHHPVGLKNTRGSDVFWFSLSHQMVLRQAVVVFLLLSSNEFGCPRFGGKIYRDFPRCPKSWENSPSYHPFYLGIFHSYFGMFHSYSVMFHSYSGISHDKLTNKWGIPYGTPPIPVRVSIHRG